jgi:hypothetical protein
MYVRSTVTDRHARWVIINSGHIEKNGGYEGVFS